MFGNGISLADIAAVSGGNRNNGGFGDGGGIWALIILFALFGRGGWGNGNGDNGSQGSTVVNNTVPYLDAALQRGFDNQSVINKLNGLENGLCSLGYDQLGQMGQLQQAIQTAQFAAQQTAQGNQIANMQSFNALESQLSNCCCENRAAIAQVRYDMATDTCAITTAIKDAARDIMDNDNCNFRQLYDQQVQMQMQAKDAEIGRLNAALTQCANRNDLAGLESRILSAVNPTPEPSYVVPNPHAWGNWGWNQWNSCGNSCNNWGNQFVG